MTVFMNNLSISAGGIEKGKGLWSLQYLSLTFVFPREKETCEKLNRSVLPFSIRRFSCPSKIDGKRENVKKKNNKKEKKYSLLPIPCAFKVKQRSLFTKILQRRHAYKSKFDIQWLLQMGGN